MRRPVYQSLFLFGLCLINSLFLMNVWAGGNILCPTHKIKLNKNGFCWMCQHQEYADDDSDIVPVSEAEMSQDDHNLGASSSQIVHPPSWGAIGGSMQAGSMLVAAPLLCSGHTNTLLHKEADSQLQKTSTMYDAAQFVMIDSLIPKIKNDVPSVMGVQSGMTFMERLRGELTGRGKKQQAKKFPDLPDNDFVNLFAGSADESYIDYVYLVLDTPDSQVTYIGADWDNLNQHLNSGGVVIRVIENNLKIHLLYIELTAEGVVSLTMADGHGFENIDLKEFTTLILNLCSSLICHQTDMILLPTLPQESVPQPLPQASPQASPQALLQPSSTFEEQEVTSFIIQKLRAKALAANPVYNPAVEELTKNGTSELINALMAGYGYQSLNDNIDSAMLALDSNFTLLIHFGGHGHFSVMSIKFSGGKAHICIDKSLFELQKELINNVLHWLVEVTGWKIQFFEGK